MFHDTDIQRMPYSAGIMLPVRKALCPETSEVDRLLLRLRVWVAYILCLFCGMCHAVLFGLFPSLTFQHQSQHTIDLTQ